MKIQPQGSRCLIKVKEMESKFGIILSTNNQIIFEKAEVLAVGPKVEKIKKGDEILFKSYNISIIELDKKKKVVFIEEKDIEAIIR